MTTPGACGKTLVGQALAILLPLSVAAATMGPFVFTDGFETGDESAWTTAIDGTGAVGSVTATAALGATGFGLGLSMLDPMSGGTEAYVQTDVPDAEAEVRALFRARWTSLALPEGVATHLVLLRALDAEVDGETVFELRLRRAVGSAHYLQLAVNDSTGSGELSQAVCLNTGVERALEVRWRSPGPGVRGYLELRVNGTREATLSGTILTENVVEAFRLGAMRCASPGTCGVPSPFEDATGRLDLDEFESYPTWTPEVEPIFVHDFECQGAMGWSTFP